MDLLLLALKIFFVRIIDVSLGTFRTIVLVKGKTKTASIIGFFEVLIWFLIVKEALNTDSNSLILGISYALGFATGTYIGGYISDLFITGIVSIKVITLKATDEMIKTIRKSGYAVSIINLVSSDKNHPKNLLLLEVNKKEINNIKNIIKSFDDNAFIVIDESKYVINGYFKEK